MNKDLEHLRLLSIFYYIVSGIIALFACIPFIHLFMGIFFLANAPEMRAAQKPGEPDFPVEIFGAMFVIIPAIIILLGWTLAVLTFIAGRKLSKQTGYTFCFVIAGLLCMFMPFGTILGVFTIIVLTRDSVKSLFNGATPMQYGAAPPSWK
ncbi:MAG: hypothetical protein KIS76_15355 [Pyrinomonadaceae bacterium]|nr:hypothetical protein [Pyrinomonadaceae bacterium]